MHAAEQKRLQAKQYMQQAKSLAKRNDRLNFAETLAAQQAWKMAAREVLNSNVTQCLVDTQNQLTTALNETSQLRDKVKEHLNTIKTLSDKNMQAMKEKMELLKKMDVKAGMLIKAHKQIADVRNEKMKIEHKLENMEFDKKILREQLDVLLDQDGFINSVSGGENNHTTTPETDSAQ